MAKIGLDVGHDRNTFPPGKGVYRNGKGYAEYDFNYKLSMRIKELLEHNGHTVVMAPHGASLTSRTNLYNREKCDIVLSIHANAGNKNVEGRCVFYWGTSSKGKQLARLVRDEIKNAGYSLHGNGLHAGRIGEWTNLHITRETRMPAVLIEHGFMTNDKDFELIFGSKQAEYVEDMAVADVKAVQRYYGKSFKNTNSTPSQSTSTRRIRTGGLNEENLAKVVAWLTEAGWYWTASGTKGNNPKITTGGLSDSTHKRFSDWLEKEGLYYQTIN